MTCKCDCNPICLCECHEAEQCRKDHYSGISEWKNEGVRKEYFKFFEGEAFRKGVEASLGALDESSLKFMSCGCLQIAKENIGNLIK